MQEQSNMTFMDLGTSSAKRATWRETDTRPLLQKLIAANPGVDNVTLFKLFWNEIEDDKDHLRSIAQYWFDLALLALQRKPHRTKPRAQEQREHVETVKEGIKQRIEHEAKVVLLQLLMPNGKTLGECSGQDCRRFGGWFTILARKVPAGKLVADTLSEKQVYQIWTTASSKK
jgi:hypothetical protein